MKILWVRAGPFFPLDTGGRIRTWNILNQLGKLEEVTALFYSLSSLAVSQDGVEHSLAELIAMRYPGPAQKFTLAYSLDYLRKLLSPAPYSVRKFVASAVRHRVRELLRPGRFDVAVCDFLSSSLNMPARSTCPQVLFAHNVETVIWERHFRVERNPLRKLVMGLEYWKMRRFEFERAGRFDHVMTVSDADRKSFARFIPPERVSVLPTGVDLGYFQPAALRETDDQLVFTGSMDWLPNEDGIVWFAREVLPLVRRARPKTALKVVGRDPTSQVQRLARETPAIELTGRVPDVRPHLASAAVYVVPLRVGGGTRLKIYEAMAMGKAVISTHVGAEGLPVKHEEHLLLADEPEEFARAVVRLLEDAALRRRLGQAAREFVASRYGWPAVAKTCREILARVAESRVGADYPRLARALSFFAAFFFW